VVSAALLAGQELGFGPMASLRSIDIIKGTPALRAIALRALVQKHGHDIWVVESTAYRAIVRARRVNGEVQQSVWTLDRAKQLGLYPGKDGSQWRRQPQSMLVARATAEVARWVAADSILGLPYIAEELADGQPWGDETGLEPDAAAEGEPPAKPKKTAQRKPALPPAAPPPAHEQQQPPPAATEASGTGPPGKPPRPISTEQLAALHAKLRDAGITDRTDAQAMISTWIDRAVGSSADLTYDEAKTVLAELTDAIHALRQQQAAKGMRPTQDVQLPADDGQPPDTPPEGEPE
jgi:hypothetical protein